MQDDFQDRGKEERVFGQSGQLRQEVSKVPAEKAPAGPDNVELLEEVSKDILRRPVGKPVKLVGSKWKIKCRGSNLDI